MDMPSYFSHNQDQILTALVSAFKLVKGCVEDLECSNPGIDKVSIEKSSGGLSEQVYHCFLAAEAFKKWRTHAECQLLWIKGDPGKGKTMLLCGIIDHTKAQQQSAIVAYFFCHKADSSLNSASAVLRGLLFMLIQQQQSLELHATRMYNYEQDSPIEDRNSWVAVKRMFRRVLEDLHRMRTATYFFIDALDECDTDKEKLLLFVSEQLSAFPSIKWVLSSRQLPKIGTKPTANRVDPQARVVLDLEKEKKLVSKAVKLFIEEKVNQFYEGKRDCDRKSKTIEKLEENAGGSFLCIAFVCKKLAERPELDPSQAPQGIWPLYEEELDHLKKSESFEACREVMATAAILQRPARISELKSLMDGDFEAPLSLQNIVRKCRAFLYERDDTIHFIHKSVQDYLLKEGSGKVFPKGIPDAHHVVFRNSIKILTKGLKRDIYSLDNPGVPINDVKAPKRDPMEPLRYSSVHWIDHLQSSQPTSSGDLIADPSDLDIVEKFLKEKYMYWLEGLSLCKRIPSGEVALEKLYSLVKGTKNAGTLKTLAQDAQSFLAHHSSVIQSFPLQTYASALLFSPMGSSISKAFRQKLLKHINMKPEMKQGWGPCIQTLRDVEWAVNAVAFSQGSDPARVASAEVNTVKLWELSSGKCEQTFTGHEGTVNSVALSHDSTRIASASDDGTVRLWEVGKTWQNTLKGHGDAVNHVIFSRKSDKLASASKDKTVKVWKTDTGECLYTLGGHNGAVNSVAFNRDSTKMASASEDRTVKVWKLEEKGKGKGKCLQTIEGHMGSVKSVAISMASDLKDNSISIASASADQTVKLWDWTGKCRQTLKGHKQEVTSVVFSHGSTKIASASVDQTIRIWEVSSGESLKTFYGHKNSVTSVSFLQDSTKLASGSKDGTLKVWDLASSDKTSLKRLDGHENYVVALQLSTGCSRLATVSEDKTLKIWDANSGECQQTLQLDRLTIHMEFDQTKAILKTEHGDIPIQNTETASATATDVPGRSALQKSTKLSCDGTWISSDGRKELWIPSEYRAPNFKIRGNRIAFGTWSGRVWICDVNVQGKKK